MESVSPTLYEVLQPAQEHIEALETDLTAARQEAADAIANLAGYKAAVRKTVIANIKNGTICLAGANDALEEWGDEPYEPKYNVRMTIDVEVTVDANDEDHARDRAYNSIYVASSEDEYPFYVNQMSVDDVTEVGEGE